MPDMSAIENTPEISFIDNKTVEDVRSEMVADYEEHMTQAQGVTVSLDRASVHRMILYAAAAQIYQAMQYIDRQGKQSLLKYSYSDYLDNLALFKGVTRSPATAATCTLRFTDAAIAAGRTERKAVLDAPCRSLRVVGDASSLEIFLNDGAAVLSTRYYPAAGKVAVQLCGVGSTLYSLSI